VPRSPIEERLDDNKKSRYPFTISNNSKQQAQQQAAEQLRKKGKASQVTSN